MSLGWGYANGAIPAAVMHVAPNFKPLPNQRASVANGSNLMKTEAAVQLSGMMQAFYRQRGRVLALSEGYRPIIVQDWYYARFIDKSAGWTLAAYPGTSIHGYALSADLNINGANPAGDDLAWLRLNAARWGFVNDVASEPWHWSYRTDRVTRTVVVKNYISNPQAADSVESLPSNVKKALMAAPDTLIYAQRQDPKTGKDTDVYFIAGPGVFADIITADKKATALVSKTGLTAPQIRTQLNRMGVKAVKLAAADFDQQRIIYKSLMDLSA